MIYRSCCTAKEGEVDRISALPEPILQHILSFLPFKEAAHASLLSKKWKEAWDTLPVLSFDESVFTLDLWDLKPEQSDDKPSRVRRRKKKLFERLEKILEKRRKELISIDKLSIYIEVSNQKEFLSFVDRCTCYAIESNVKELKFEFGTLGRIWYNVPGSIFQAHSIDILKLSGCKLELLRSNVKLNSLRKLCLEYVYAENYAVENFLGGCPSIEELLLSSCKGFKILELFNVVKLNTIKLRCSSQLEQVEINALNVHFIELSDISVQCEFNLTACKNLKSLKLRYLLVSDEWLYNQVSELPVLEYLNITWCMKLRAIFIASSRLKRLSIGTCKKLFEIKIEAPNLTSFKYDGEMISFSSNTPDTILETDLFLDSQKMGTRWYAKYIELLAKFNRSSTMMNLRSEIGQV
ncbi:F-box protein [Melia azedarach]|uniref:F-box protein n=1 Tax=Melia azedarach TaxID=155640 RepID=A0ACC1Y477_MELAZ|nr:F-box protein [Melia azedarach]